VAATTLLDPPAVDLTLPTTSAADRIADAALQCIADQGIRATTVEAIAVQAGVGRATIYRHFRGGRAEVILTAGHRELERFAAVLGPECEATETIEDLLLVALRGTYHALSTSGPIQELLQREPELVLPHLGFDRMPDVFIVATELMARHFRRFIADEQAIARLCEWITRLVLSHLLAPTADLDLDDPDAVRVHLGHFVLPGLTTLSPTNP
jgi:AcrR family transcriptional regulator